MILALMVAVGAVYNIPLMPGFVGRSFHFRRLREIPGSKTIFSAAAWVMVMVVVIGGRWVEDMPLMVVLLMLLFVRNGFYDLMDMQGDRIMGIETLPVFMGEAAAVRLLWILMGTGSVISIVFPMTLHAVRGNYALSGAWIFLTLVYYLFRSGRIKPGFVLELTVDAVFLLVWLLVTGPLA